MSAKKYLVHQEKRRASYSLRNKVFLTGLFCLLLIPGAYLSISFAPFLSISTITVSDPEFQEEALQITDAALNGAYLKVFKKRSMLTLPISTIKESLLLTIPEINNVAFRREFPSTLHILLFRREPQFRAETGFFIDKEGSFYEERLREIKLPLLLTKNIKTPEDIALLKGFTDKVEVRLGRIETIRGLGDNDLEFRFADKELKLLLNLGQLKKDPEELWSRLLTSLDTQPLSLYLTGTSTLDYIDLRFGNKVYFKKQSTSETTAHGTSTATTTRLLEQPLQ